VHIRPITVSTSNFASPNGLRSVALVGEDFAPSSGPKRGHRYRSQPGGRRNSRNSPGTSTRILDYSTIGPPLPGQSRLNKLTAPCARPRARIECKLDPYSAGSRTMKWILGGARLFRTNSRRRQANSKLACRGIRDRFDRRRRGPNDASTLARDRTGSLAGDSTATALQRRVHRIRTSLDIRPLADRFAIQDNHKRISRALESRTLSPNMVDAHVLVLVHLILPLLLPGAEGRAAASPAAPLCLMTGALATSTCRISPVTKGAFPETGSRRRCP